MFVKLQRPPPEIAIFLPTRSECSRTRTLRPRFPASIAQKRPAAPPPMTMTSHFIESFSNPKYSTDYADYADKTKRRQGQDTGAGTYYIALLLPAFPTSLVLCLCNLRNLWMVSVRASKLMAIRRSSPGRARDKSVASLFDNLQV